MSTRPVFWYSSRMARVMCARVMELPPAAAFPGAPDDEAPLLEGVHHPGDGGRVHLEVVGQLPLAAGAVLPEVVHHLGLARPQADALQTGPQEAALGVESPVQQKMKGGFHRLPSHT